MPRNLSRTVAVIKLNQTFAELDLINRFGEEKWAASFNPSFASKIQTQIATLYAEGMERLKPIFTSGTSHLNAAEIETYKAYIAYAQQLINDANWALIKAPISLTYLDGREIFLEHTSQLERYSALNLGTWDVDNVNYQFTKSIQTSTSELLEKAKSLQDELSMTPNLSPFILHFAGLDIYGNIPAEDLSTIRSFSCDCRLVAIQRASLDWHTSGGCVIPASGDSKDKVSTTGPSKLLKPEEDGRFWNILI